MQRGDRDMGTRVGKMQGVGDRKESWQEDFRWGGRRRGVDEVGR